MPSRAPSDIVRIGSNYARLLTGLIFGLILVPLLLAWIGNAGYGVYALIMVSVGLGTIFEEITRSSLVRELGHTYHDPGRSRFVTIYNSAFILSGAVSLLAMGVFLVLLAIVPTLNLDPRLHAAARVMIFAEGVTTVLYTLASPVMNMMLVTLRFVLDNVLLVLRRVSYLLAVVLCTKVLGLSNPLDDRVLDYESLSVRLEAFGLTSNAISLLVLAAAVIVVLILEPATRPKLTAASKEGIRVLLPQFGWNAAVNLALNMYDRAGGLILNLAFGLTGSVVWGLALQLAAYVRMVSLGVNSGVDAIAAKLSAGDEESRAQLAWFTRYSTTLHALVAFPAAIAIGLLTRPMLELWVGRHVEEPERVLPIASNVTQLLLIPIVSRSVSDAWLRILYGAGHVGRYAPMVLIAGLINLVVASIATFALPLSDEWRILMPAITYAVVYSFAHFFLFPLLYARHVGLTGRDMLTATLRPLAISLLSAAVLVLANKLVTDWTLIKLGAAGACFGGVYALLAFAFVIPPQRRRSLLARIPKPGPLASWFPDA